MDAFVRTFGREHIQGSCMMTSVARVLHRTQEVGSEQGDGRLDGKRECLTLIIWWWWWRRWKWWRMTCSTRSRGRFQLRIKAHGVVFMLIEKKKLFGVERQRRFPSDKSVVIISHIHVRTTISHIQIVSYHISNDVFSPCKSAQNGYRKKWWWINTAWQQVEKWDQKWKIQKWTWLRGDNAWRGRQWQHDQFHRFPPRTRTMVQVMSHSFHPHVHVHVSVSLSFNFFLHLKFVDNWWRILHKEGTELLDSPLLFSNKVSSADADYDDVALVSPRTPSTQPSLSTRSLSSSSMSNRVGQLVGFKLPGAQIRTLTNWKSKFLQSAKQECKHEFQATDVY